MADSIWEFYKLEIERLYIDRKQTLPQVREYMADKYDFKASKSQYEKQFAKWGLSKNKTLTPSQGRFIGKRVEKRKREYQKESEVYIDGNHYAPTRVKKAKYGKGFVSTIDNLPNAPSPDTPEGVVVCTPATPGMRLIWGATLPWLRFSKLLKPGQDDSLPSLPSTPTAPSPQSAGALVNRVNQELMQRLASIVPWRTLALPPNVNSSSRLFSGLSVLMPEEYHDQHRTLATRLCSSRQPTVDSLSLELFLLSNNLISHGSTPRSESSMFAHDKHVMNMFRMSGWKNKKQIEILLSTKEPTAEAISEKLFASALRLYDLDTVEMMLKAGADPNSRIETVHRGPLTCLQFAATVDCIEEEESMIELFLSHGADINLSFNGNSALHYALEERNWDAVHMLLSHGCLVTPSCLAIAASHIRDGDFFFEFLNQSHVDVNARSGWQDASALAHAVMSKNLPIVNILLARGADINALVDIDFDQDWGLTTVLGLAVKFRDLGIIQAIVQTSLDLNPDFDGLPYISPLVIAVRGGHLDITQLLLQAGVDIRFAEQSSRRTLLEWAVLRKNIDLCNILIEYGATVHWPLSDEEQASSALLVAIEKDVSDIIYLIIRTGAPLNQIYSNAPGTVLAAAIEKGDQMLIQTLEWAGAMLIGPKLRRIGNLETAIYLHQRGILQDILHTCGPQILRSAIVARDDNLTEWLLSQGVDVNGKIPDTDASTASRTPLGAAILAGNVSITEAIIARGAKVTDYDLANAVTNPDPSLLQRLLTVFRGNAPTAISHCIWEEEPELMQLILDAGADPTGTPTLSEEKWCIDEDLDFRLDPPASILEIAVVQADRQILHTLLQSCLWDPKLVGRALTLAILLNNVQIIEDLLESVVDVNQEFIIHHLDVEGEDGEEVQGWDEIITPLQVAVKDQRVSVVRDLIKVPDIDINHLGDGTRRRTALQHAVDSGNMELVNLLLGHLADINSAPARDGGATALQIAAIQGFLGIARKLLDLDADVNAPAAKIQGRTALEGAAEYGRIDMLQMLLDEGALLVGDDGERQYRRAVELAEKNGHNAAARLLKRFKK